MSKLIQKFIEWWARDEFAERMAEVRERMDEEERKEVRNDLAKFALTGLLADHEFNAEPELAARIAYAYADAMMKEGSK